MLIRKILTLSSTPPTRSQMSLLVRLPESYGGRIRSIPQPATSSSSWLSTLTYRPGDEQQTRCWPRFWDVVSSHRHDQAINGQIVFRCSVGSSDWSFPINIKMYIKFRKQYCSVRVTSNICCSIVSRFHIQQNTRLRESHGTIICFRYKQISV
jgi:hypothetical protein